MMNCKIKVWAGRASDGAKELADALGAKRIKLEGSSYVNRANHLVVNWGSSSIPFQMIGRVLNPPDAVAVASNKLQTFERLNKDIVPEWTTDRSTAAVWLEKGASVCVRQKLRASGGDGLVIFGPNNFKEWGQLAVAPLYTRYVKKAAEYRVHVFQADVIDVQQKRLKADLPDDFKPNFQIQNLENGFIYARENVNPPKAVLDNSIQAVAELGLDFGAVDVVWNDKKGLAVVLEVNTAPGLMGTTINSYAAKIKEFANV